MKYIYIYIGLIILALSSCDELLEIDDPKNELPSGTIFSKDETAIAALSGAYSTLSTNLTYAMDITLNSSLSSDELLYQRNSNYDDIVNNELNAELSNQVNGMWANFYTCIYRFNSIIEGLENNTVVSPEVNKQLVAESKFMRAYSYFYLVNFYGDVPLVLTTDVNKTALAPRTEKSLVYDQIIADLTDARDNLKDDYSASPGLRTNANKWAATALLARAYLYKDQWELAESYASEVIDQTSLYKLLDGTDLRNVFLNNSQEAILQLGPYSSQGTYTYEGIAFATDYTVYTLRDGLIEEFEKNENDLRRTTWIRDVVYSGIESHQPYKYQINSISSSDAGGLEEYPTVLRLAEQYLIRAEARAKQNKITGNEGAIADLNRIRNRAGVESYTGSTNLEDVTLAIERERRLELFCELGHRWFDLRRTGRLDTVLGTLKPSTWNMTDAYYPIPRTAINSNPNLTQNAGY